MLQSVMLKSRISPNHNLNLYKDFLSSRLKSEQEIIQFKNQMQEVLRRRIRINIIRKTDQYEIQPIQQVQQLNGGKENNSKQSEITIAQLNKQLSDKQEYLKSIQTQNKQLKEKNQQLNEQLEYMREQHDDEKRTIGIIIQEQIIKIKQLSESQSNYQVKNEQLTKEVNQLQQKNILQNGFQDLKNDIQQQEIVSLIHKPYEIIPEFTQIQSEYCYAIAFNRESTIMIAGCDSNITVFEFKQGQLNEKQLLSDHNSDYYIRTLFFMTKYNQFISGNDKEIGIWSYNNTTQQYYCLQMLKQAHSDYVNRVIMNKNEDLIISCSDDKTIKLWINKNEWECSQILTNHSDYVLDICLNESCTQLVSCDYSGKILISQQGCDQKWTVMQTIKTNWGCKICYINDNLIAFQPRNGTKMETYQLNQQNKQFIKYKDVSVENDNYCNDWFPMQLNKYNQLLLNKNGYRINLIRFNNNNFTIEQSINFGTNNVWGAMTDDFQYLVTWDYESKEFQVRKQK